MTQETVSGSEKAMAALGCGSALLDDETFVAQFESCHFPSREFRHADHIRLAWIYIRKYEYRAAEARMGQSIRRFASHVGAHRKYHETMTLAWMRLVRASCELSPMLDFTDFAHSHSWLLNKEAVFEFYTRERLMSDLARQTWIEPDLKPISACTERMCEF
jgi:hypothetical protein